jgi:hypothetical protein
LKIRPGTVNLGFFDAFAIDFLNRHTPIAPLTSCRLFKLARNRQASTRALPGNYLEAQRAQRAAKQCQELGRPRWVRFARVP